MASERCSALPATLVRASGDFLIPRALEAVNELIQAREMVVLSRRDWEAFMDALEYPPAPNAKLERVSRRYDRLDG